MLFRSIETLIRARYPLLFVVCSEEMRAREALLAIAARRQKKAYEWSVTTGLLQAGVSIQSQKSRNPATKDPLVALEWVVDSVEPALFIFKDFHPFLAAPHHAVIRRLKEVAIHLKNSFKTVVLLGPVLQTPVEIGRAHV